MAVVQTYGNIANVEEQLRNFQKALDLNEMALEIFVKVLSRQHVSCTATLGNVANVHSTLGQKEEAINRSQQASKIFLENLGPNYPSTLLEAINLHYTVQVSHIILQFDLLSSRFFAMRFNCAVRTGDKEGA